MSLRAMLGTTSPRQGVRNGSVLQPQVRGDSLLASTHEVLARTAAGLLFRSNIEHGNVCLGSTAFGL